MNPTVQSDSAVAGNAGQTEPVLQLAQPTEETLQKILCLYEEGLCLQAFRACQGLAPLKAWKSVRARTLAGRLAFNIGGYKTGQVLHWLSWRSDKSNPDLAAYHGYNLLQRRGSLATLEFLDRFGTPCSDADPEGLLHFFTLRAMVAGHFRDFKASDDFLNHAIELVPDDPWVLTTQAHVLELQDRYQESLAAAQRAIELRPWYRPGVQALGHALQLLDRDEEAMQLLLEASNRLENLHVTRQLAALQIEQGLYREAAQSIERAIELAPLMERAERKAIQGQRVMLACFQEDFASARELARQADEPYYSELIVKLEGASSQKRVRLNVPFVRQHHMTCAPATLSALSRFWGRPAEHLELAEAICYDGTPAHSERNWAEGHGWIGREFTVTWESAVALLDRGVPFTLTTTEATSAHLQAVVGYDGPRKTLWIRDPFTYFTKEVPAEPFLERYLASGPRGMTLAPADERVRVDGLKLPDAELYDQLHSVEECLSKHQRDQALQICQEMGRSASEHRLTYAAKRSIAAYDSNSPALLECLEALLKQFPENGNLNLAKLSCLRELARRNDRLELLEQLCAKSGIDPIFWQQYAQELRCDARQHSLARTWVRWALRYRPTDPALISAWADLLWDQREREVALDYYRLAACAGDKNEQFSRSYFVASRHLRQTDTALAFLRERDRRLGPKSPSPTITLVESLGHIGRTVEAFEVLEAALARRPEDGVLALFAADFYGRYSHFEKAAKLLEGARSHTANAAWHRAAASLSNYRNHKLTGLLHWREVLAIEPLAHDAIRAITLLLAETEGRQSALKFLNELCQRFPCSCPLLALRVQWVKESGPREVLPYVRALLEINPADAWAWRELAMQAKAAGEISEARKAAEEAIRLEPHRSYSYTARAEILIQERQTEAARADLLQALRLEIDNEFALFQFVSTGSNLAERKNALSIVQSELRRQVILGNALFVFKDVARGLLSPEELLNLLHEARGARPDLWQTWSVLLEQLTDMGRHDEALKRAQEATDQFPLVPRIWIDLARVQQARLNSPGQIAALEKALEINPGYMAASHQLAGIYERQSSFDKARAVLEAAVAGNPLDAVSHAWLAHVLWQSSERENALSRLQHALLLQPGYEWAWNNLRAWGGSLGKPSLAADMARELTRCRSGEARSWLLLAKALTSDPQQDSAALAVRDAFAALDRAVMLNPHCEDAFDYRAQLLAKLNRFDEALATCLQSPLQPAPIGLQLRAAWIDSQRGNLAQAITRAKVATQDHPDSYHGWRLLSEWYCQTQQNEEAVAAAEKMAGLAPLEAMPFGYLGDLKLRLGDTAGATAAFERAFSLDPNYQYAGFQLFRQQLRTKAFAAARQTLQRLEVRSKTPQTISCAIELAVAEDDSELGLKLFEKLCSMENANATSISEAHKALTAPCRRRALHAMVRRHMLRGHSSAGLAEFWIEREIKKGHWAAHATLQQLSGQAQKRAVCCYLHHLGQAYSWAKENSRHWDRLRFRFHFGFILRRHRHWLREDDEGWGQVGYVFSCIGRARPAVEWLGDWKSHPRAESWIFHNLVTMLQQMHRYDESREVILHAVSLRHSEELYPVFRLWAAFEEALSGDIKLAEQHLEQLRTVEIKEHLTPLRTMSRLLIELRQKSASPPDFGSSFRSRIKQAFGKAPPCNAGHYVRHAYKRIIRAASDLGGGDSLRLWGAWFYRGDQWLIFGLVALIPILALTAPGAILFVIIALLILRRK